MDRKIQLLSNPALHLGKSVFRGRLDAENYIDMGLPSGTKWAPSNLDVKSETGLAASPFQYECSFFSWGNIEGHNPTSETAFDYDFGGTNAVAPWYEGQPYGNTPGSTLTGNIPLDAEFDAARALLGTPWRTPLNSDFNELIANCIYIDATGTEIPDATTRKIVTVNEVDGIYLQSKINGNKLFLPCTGLGTGTEWHSRGSVGIYWNATFYSVRQANSLYFYPSGISAEPYSRHYGFAVRAVMN